MRYIPISVDDEYVRGAGCSVGAAGSHNDVALRMSFGEMWAGTTRSIVWLDANGENPTVTSLTTDMLVDGETEVYIVPIPAEPKKVAGEMRITVKGATVDGETETAATLTATAKFIVMESCWDDTAEQSADITATQAEQYQAELAAIKTTIADARAAATEAKASETAAATSETNAADSAAAAKSSAQSAYQNAKTTVTMYNDTKAKAEAAAASATKAADSENAVKKSATAAATSETNAANSAAAAAASAAAASASATNAAASAAAAATSTAAAQTAQTAAETAQKSAESAQAGVAADAKAAATSKTLAESWAVGGTGTRTGEDTNNSKYWSDKAEDIAKQIDELAKGKGLMLIATYDPDGDGSVNEADAARKLKTTTDITVGNKTNSFDGSSGISFTLADIGAEESGAAAVVQENLDAHADNTAIHITEADRTAWDGKESAGTAASAVAAHNTDASAHSSLQSTVSSMDARLSLLELVLNTDVTGNQYIVEFDTLSGVSLDGIWNTALQRVEF